MGVAVSFDLYEPGEFWNYKVSSVPSVSLLVYRSLNSKHSPKANLDYIQSSKSPIVGNCLQILSYRFFYLEYMNI